MIMARKPRFDDPIQLPLLRQPTELEELIRLADAKGIRLLLNSHNSPDENEIKAKIKHLRSLPDKVTS